MGIMEGHTDGTIVCQICSGRQGFLTVAALGLQRLGRIRGDRQFDIVA